MKSSIFIGRKLTASGESSIDSQLAAHRDQVWCRLIGWMLAGSLALYGTLCAAQTDALRPAAIQTEDVPAIPPELAARLRQYQNTRPAGFAGWSPDGQGILIRTQFANSLQLHRVDEPGGRRGPCDEVDI